MLETLERQEKAIFYTAIENIEDVSHTEISGEDAGTYYEEDKNYDEDHKFTIFSLAVKNTLVSFFDIFIGAWKSSDEIRLGFYTTATIGKERKKFVIDGAEVDAPEEPILISLSSGSILSDDAIKMVKSVVLEEYEAQYSGKKTKGHLETLREMSFKEFGEFLSKITWYFESENEKELKETVICLIRESKFHNFRVANKEEAIFSMLMETLDERQGETSLARHVVFSPEVELIFKRAESEEADLVTDPTWLELKKIEKSIKDKRNLPEKIIAVCPEYSQKKLQYLARLACRSKTEQISSNRSFLSLKYRVYEACGEYFFQEERLVNTESEIDKTIVDLKKISNEHIEQLKKDYTYTLSNHQAVDGIIMDLFDSCFVSFDEVSDEK